MIRTKAKTATRFFLYGAVLTTTVALSLSVTLPLMATAVLFKRILPRREREVDEHCGP